LRRRYPDLSRLRINFGKLHADAKILIAHQTVSYRESLPNREVYYFGLAAEIGEDPTGAARNRMAKSADQTPDNPVVLRGLGESMLLVGHRWEEVKRLRINFAWVGSGVSVR
jgi:hypothetical protein